MAEDSRSPGTGPGRPAVAVPLRADSGAGRPATELRERDLPPGWAEKLADVQSITDAALSGLDPQALLDALVERVREALQADTAAVLLLDRPSGQLVATAASGLEEEVRQGVRIPVGRGFAGRIAAEGRPVIIDHVDPGSVVNPILLTRGIQSLMGAPLLAGGAVIGVLHVGTLTARVFTRQDASLLQLAADRAALAVQSLASHLDRAAAAVLQRSLVPAALPAITGLEMAARYVPGSGNVGGDWYDVFRLPSGQVCAVIGDVAGTGLQAAVIMGRIRSALRAYALETADPADILDRLDRKMRHFEPDALATVLCAVFSRSLAEVRISSAGHLPPVIVRPGQRAALADVPAGVLIGVRVSGPRQSGTLSFPPGAALCLYTDGLVERRGRPIDKGIARLRATVTAGEPDACCVSVMGAMTDDPSHADDMALLIIRRAPGQPGGRQPGSDAPGAPVTAGPDLDVSWAGRHAVVSMPPEMDLVNSASVGDQLSAVAGQLPDVLTVDMTATVFCDSAGIRVLTRAHQLTAASSAELRLAVGDSPVARILQLTGLDQVVPVYRDARQSLATPRRQA